MKELQKTPNDYFNEVFTGINGNKEVLCYLDNNCVRYAVKINGKLKIKQEYSNNKKELCFANATKALNK